MRMGDCNGAEQRQAFTDLRGAWEVVLDGIEKVKNGLQGKSEWPLTEEYYESFHSTIFKMSTSNRPFFRVSERLYEKYKATFVEYINELVLPVLRQNPDEFMLRELVNRWNIYKKTDHYLSRLFEPLDELYTKLHSLPAVCDVGLNHFRELMCKELETTVKNAVISLFDQEHKGEQIDCTLRKDVLGIFVEIRMGNMYCYNNDFESAMLEDTAACCFWEAVSLILKDCPDYMQKAEECWRRERERLGHYLCADSKQKLSSLEQEFLRLLSHYASVKENLGCHPVLQYGKVYDLPTMYRRIPKIPEPKAHFFKQHVTDEGTTLVKQAEDAASNKKVLPVLRQKPDEFMLRELVNRWKNNHDIMICWLSWYFYSFHRYFTSRCSLQVLHDVGPICFRNLVYQELKTTVRDAVILLIDWEREGEQIDRALLKNVLGIFVEIGMGNMDCYENDFESAMLEDTAIYYSRKAASWIMEDSCPDYMQKAEECLKGEKERVSHYLHADSEQKLLGRVERELLSQYKDQLLKKEHSGCHSLLQDGKMDDLSRMYRLFCRIPEDMELIALFFKQHVTDEGTTLVKQAEDAASNKKAFVWKVIELHEKYSQYVSTCFVNHSLFHKALKEAFEVLCNKGVAGSTSAELLATYCDNILKKGSSEKLSDEDIEETLEKVVKLLAYIDDKDLYSEFYREKLARRLIFDKSANDEHERSILTKLKQQNGGQFTSKMEGMLYDLTLARENQPEFQKYLDDNAHAHPGIDLTVTVLTTGFWPSYKSFDLNLPAEMVKCVEVFKEFYQTQSKQRKLTWIYSLGTCHLSGNFNARSVELIVTTHQGAALLLFNNAERLSYSEIKSQLKLSDEDIITLLHSLACSKHKILIKEPNTKSVTQSDYFNFNANFTDKSRKIKIPLPPVDEKKKKKIIEEVNKDRRYPIDACIVRIMKSRKVLPHAQLVTECVEQLGRMFKPDFKAITKRIEDLITREYLERDKMDPMNLRYLA